VDLAKLVARLELQSSQFQTELEKTNRKLLGFQKQTNRSLSSIEKSVNSFGKTIKGVVVALGAGTLFRSVIRSTAEAEKSFAQLEAAVRSTGGVAGFTAPQLAKMASSLQGVTTFSDDAIQGMQAILLTFTKIRGPEFEGAQKAILDVSARLGVDLKSAALQVGKALNDPIKGVSALSRAGIQLSESQQSAIKSMVKMGDVAGAQRTILKELGTQFGGAAEAARNNFGGALEGVGNALGDLLEAKGGLPAATASLNEMAKTLQDPAIVAGADALFSTLIRGASAAGTFIAEVSGGLAILAGQGTNAIVNLDLKLDKLAAERKRILSSVGGDESLLGPGFKQDLARIDAQMDDLLAKQARLLEVGAFSGNARLQEFSPSARKLEAPASKTRLQAIKDEIEFLKILGQQSDNTKDRLLSEADFLLGQVATDQERAKAIDELEEIDLNAIRAKKTFLKTTDEMSVIAKRASENIHDSFANFLFDPFADGLDGMLKGFINVIRRMVAEAAAAKLFSSKSSGGLGFGDFLSGMFGGFLKFADGGRPPIGRPSIVGERGPELFVPDTAGTIIPNGMGGGISVTNYNYFTGAADTDLRAAMPAFAKQISDTTVARVRDMQRHGKRI
jgi:hypothetical protein